MRFFYALLMVITPALMLRAQDALVVLPGTDVVFSANTMVSVDDLTITPASDFIASGFSLNKFTSILYPSFNIAIARVYRFSTAIENFSGSIRIRYEDSELNGLLESGLRLNIHDGSVWKAYDNSTNDAVGNTVLTASLTDLRLNELTLADVASQLPLRWGPVSASRVKRSVLVEWTAYEQSDLSHFAVERSLDARRWDPVKTEIPAFNLASKKYAATDENYHSGELFYRVKGIDIDGRYTYSPVRAVGAENIRAGFILYPNPTQTSFYLAGDSPENIREVQLYNAGGSLVKTWKPTQHGYSVASLPAGAYNIRIVKKDNAVQFIRIAKP